MQVLIRILPALMFLMSPAHVGALTELECRQDSQALLKEIADNRRLSNDQYRQALAEAGSESERRGLKEQMEQTWHEEERQLNTADQLLRDCLHHVRRLEQQAAKQ